MTKDKSISNHYSHGGLLAAIQAALNELGKSSDSVTIEDLAAVDEFHIGGRQATENFMAQLNLTEQDSILDVGCGLGGASRFVADRYKSTVTGIDLTKEYIETGNTLCEWVDLDARITLHHGSALSMPFADDSFDGAYMLHVGMNIADKVGLFREVRRVLRPGATFGIYDVMQNKDGELRYPVPWATDSRTSELSTPGQYKQALQENGFEITGENDRYEFAMEFFTELRAKTEAAGGPPPLGLHTLMQATTADKIRNMIDNIAARLISPVELIGKRI